MTKIGKGKMKKGRYPEFKCIYCGKFVSYDRRTVTVENRTEARYSTYQEQFFPEEIVIMYHKKCKRKEKDNGKQQ